MRHMFLLGSGLNLDAIHENTCTTLRFYGLTDAEIRQLVPVLKKNKSAREFYIDWENLSDEQVALFINGKITCCARNFVLNMPLLYPKEPFIVACEKGLWSLSSFGLKTFVMYARKSMAKVISSTSGGKLWVVIVDIPV